MCDGNAARQTTLGKLAWPGNYVMSSLGLREHRTGSGPHKVILIGLVWVTEKT